MRRPREIGRGVIAEGADVLALLILVAELPIGPGRDMEEAADHRNARLFVVEVDALVELVGQIGRASCRERVS
jgi:hypothetical protein